MGIMSFLRNRAGVILIVAIGLAIVSFLISDAVQFGGPLMGRSNDVGSIDGETISYEEFNSRVEQNANNLKQQTGQGTLNPQMNAYVIENSWNQAISEVLMSKEFERLGLAVSKNELNDMITGKNPHPQVVQSFGDPATGEINRSQLNAFLGQLDTQDPSSPVRQQWGSFLLAIKQDRMAQKYNNLIRNSLYVTSLEAKDEYESRNKLASFRYVTLPYTSIPDAQVKLTDEDYKEFYNQNKYRFNNPEESRTFEYVVFDAKPSKEDSIEVKNRINKIAADFKAAKDDSLFVSINADTKVPVSYVKKGQLDPALDSLVFNAAEGTVVGPVFTGDAFKVAKVLDSRVGPDSVKASHIL
ncbi:MAG TPA: SurA N-terminal domain-containing protein, partial [Sphingobacteriaceae bacterium]